MNRLKTLVWTVALLALAATALAEDPDPVAPPIEPEHQTVQTETLVRPQIQMLMGDMGMMGDMGAMAVGAGVIDYAIYWGDDALNGSAATPEMNLTLVQPDQNGTVYYHLDSCEPVTLTVKNHSVAGLIDEEDYFTGDIVVSASDFVPADSSVTGITSALTRPTDETGTIPSGSESGGYTVSYSESEPHKWIYNQPSHTDSAITTALTSSVTFTIEPQFGPVPDEE